MQSKIERVIALAGDRSALSRSLTALRKGCSSGFEEINRIPGITEDRVKFLVSLGCAETGTTEFGKPGYGITALGEAVLHQIGNPSRKTSTSRLKFPPPMS